MCLYLLLHIYIYVCVRKIDLQNTQQKPYTTYLPQVRNHGSTARFPLQQLINPPSKSACFLFYTNNAANFTFDVKHFYKSWITTSISLRLYAYWGSAPASKSFNNLFELLNWFKKNGFLKLINPNIRFLGINVPIFLRFAARYWPIHCLIYNFITGIR
jgi:hypothetical protein